MNVATLQSGDITRQDGRLRIADLLIAPLALPFLEIAKSASAWAALDRAADDPGAADPSASDGDAGHQSAAPFGDMVAFTTPDGLTDWTRPGDLLWLEGPVASGSPRDGFATADAATEDPAPLFKSADVSDTAQPAITSVFTSGQPLTLFSAKDGLNVGSQQPADLAGIAGIATVPAALADGSSPLAAAQVLQQAIADATHALNIGGVIFDPVVGLIDDQIAGLDDVTGLAHGVTGLVDDALPSLIGTVTAVVAEHVDDLLALVAEPVGDLLAGIVHEIAGTIADPTIGLAGDAAPVAATILSDDATHSLDWMLEGPVGGADVPDLAETNLPEFMPAPVLPPLPLPIADHHLLG